MSKTFDFWRFVVNFRIAKTGWFVSTSHKGIKRHYILSLHIGENDGLKGLGFIVGPIAIMIGFS